MRSIILALLLLFSTFASATENDLSILNPELRKLYHQLTEGVALEGLFFEFEARLKAANEKAILLQDGYIDTGEGMLYAFLKFERGYTLPQGLEQGQKIRLLFQIKEGRNDNTTPGMPYLLVELVRIEPVD